MMMGGGGLGWVGGRWGEGWGEGTLLVSIHTPPPPTSLPIHPPPLYLLPIPFFSPVYLSLIPMSSLSTRLTSLARAGAMPR